MEVKKSFVLLALSFLILKATASSDNTLYSIRDLPLVNTLNPAFQPKRGNFYVGFPMFSSLNGFAQLTSTFLEKSRIVINKEVAGMKSHEGISINGEWRLLDFGYGFRDMYFTFGVALKATGGLLVNRDVLKLLVSGNGDFVNKNQAASLDGTMTSSMLYHEFSLGFSKELFRDALTIGANVKYLSGSMTMLNRLDNKSYWYTNPKDYSLHLSLYPTQVIVSDMILVEQERAKFDDSIFGFLFPAIPPPIPQGKGHGVSMDLGVSWKVAQLDKKLTLSCSALDLGFIHWSEAYSKKPHKNLPAVIDFNGIDMTNPSSVLEGLKKSLDDNSLIDVKREPVTTTLSGRYFAAANYRFWKYLNTGFVFGLSNINRIRYIPSYTLSVNTQDLIVNLSASYTIANGRYDNLGMGAVFGRKYVQTHLLFDNLIRVGRMLSEGFTDKYADVSLTHAYALLGRLGVRVGVNFLFGNNDREKAIKKQKTVTKN